MSQKGYILPILAVVVLILLLGSGAFYFGTKYQITPKDSGQTIKEVFISNSPNSTAQTPSPNTTVPDETANWKEFTTPTFSFKHPSEYVIKEAVKNFFTISPNEEIPPQNADISVDARLIGNFSNYETAVAKIQEGLTNKTVENYKNGTRVTGLIEEGTAGGRYIDVTIFKYGTAAIEIEYINGNIPKEIYNKILASFSIK